MNLEEHISKFDSYGNGLYRAEFYDKYTLIIEQKLGKVSYHTVFFPKFLSLNVIIDRRPLFSDSAIKVFSELEYLDYFAQETEDNESLYSAIMSGIKFEPVYAKPPKKELAKMIGQTLIYPLSVFYKVYKIREKEALDPRYDEEGYEFLEAFLFPTMIPMCIREIFNPSIEGVRVTNPEIFAKSPTPGKHYVGIDLYGAELENKFGDASCWGESGAYLQIFLPNGLELTKTFTSLPANGNNFLKCKYFLEVEPTIIESVQKVHSRFEQKIADYLGFRDSITTEDVFKLLENRK